ncbi:MAG TPA: DUF4126 family protein [Bryobacteraceae bacterium]|nr:DUF4126 family protein [Bryobacteraceae bacterium]
MSYYALAFLIGVVAGLRALTPIAAVSWAARLGRLHLENTWLAFLGYSATPYIISLLAILELVNDKLPKTPSRKAPPQFITRVVTGAFSGAALGAAGQALIGGLLLGAIGAVAGTLAGSVMRARLAKAFGGKDLPAALIEDAIAIVGAILLVCRF